MKRQLSALAFLSVCALTGSAFAETIGGTLQINVTVNTNCVANTPAVISFPSYDQVAGSSQTFAFGLTCASPIQNAAQVSLHSYATTADPEVFYLSSSSGTQSLLYQIKNTDADVYFQNDTPQNMDITDPLAPVMNAAVELPAGQNPATDYFEDYVDVLYTYF